jgi:septum formation protein
MRLILASQSPYRKYAMDLLGLDYDIIPAHIDEKSIRHDNPQIMVKKIAEAKALSVAEEHKDALIISSDAVVSSNGKIFEKPRDKNQAFEMLSYLSNNRFEFITGLVVYNAFINEKLATVTSCEIKFRSLSDFEINKYITDYPAVNCAGAFEHHGLLFFSEYIKGSYNFRTAIPVAELVLFLRKQGVQI